MEQNNQLALIIAYYISRFDIRGINELGYSTWKQAYDNIGSILGVKKYTVKNMRDDFDPYFQNARVGWHQRELSPSRKKVFEKFSAYSFEQMTDIIKKILNGKLTAELIKIASDIETEKDYILKDLNELAIITQNRFIKDFKAEEVILSQEFKQIYGSYLRTTGKDIIFQSNTVIITSTGNLKIYAPNQWFVIASFIVDLVKELIQYKYHLNEILKDRYPSSNLRTEFITELKNSPSDESRKFLKDVSNKYFLSISNDKEGSHKCSDWIVRFAVDYGWWFGQKTIYRNDFYYSPVLNIISVVNESQTFIAEIAKDFSENKTLYDVLDSIKENSYQSKDNKHVDIENYKYTRKTGGQNLIIYGAPGTGKSRLLEDMYGSIAPLTRRVVFHSEYTYYDFVGSYKPVPIYKENKSNFYNSDGKIFTKGEPYISYQFIPGPFIEVLTDAWLDPKNIYTLLIEEINRANAASVFGEIFQLLDRNPDGSSEYHYFPSRDLADYLSGIEGMVEFIKSGITLPSNMNIVATMNSSDQGVNPIDSAFKRRWDYKYLRIDIGNAVHKDSSIIYAGNDINWGDFITALNETLKQNRIDEDRLIGPYFIKPYELNSRAAVDKLLLYLWDDVLRHKRDQVFESSIRTFSDLSDNFDQKDVLNIGNLLLSIKMAKVDLNNLTNTSDDE